MSQILITRVQGLFFFVVNDGVLDSDTTWVRARINNVSDNPVLTVLSEQ